VKAPLEADITELHEKRATAVATSGVLDVVSDTAEDRFRGGFSATLEDGRTIAGTFDLESALPFTVP
jgi:hypothetical protein